MSDIYGIAKSGLQAYKEGLATTGQNIANVGNEAYARRDAPISEVKSGSEVLQISHTAGYGVRIDGITRAFDQFIDIQLQNATSGFSFSTSQAVILDQLEQVVRPPKGTVSERLQELFSALNGVAQDPSDLAGRHIAVDASSALVTSIRNVAKGISDLRTLVEDNISNDVEEANGILKQLGEIQKEMMGIVSSTSVPNDLLDQRDSLLRKLSELVDITVAYKTGGLVEVNAGTSGQGQSLLSGINVSSLSVQTVDGTSKVFLKSSHDSGLSKVQIQGGQIAGSLASDITLVETKAALDDLTRKIVSEFNDVHVMGVDLNGDLAKEYFKLNGIQIEKHGDMKSSSQLDIKGSYDSLIDQEYKLEFSAIDEKWALKDQYGKELEKFQNFIEYNGVQITVSGNAVIGDYFDISFNDGLAENLTLNLKDGRELAAGSFYLVEKDEQNTSSSNVFLSRFEEPSSSNITTLNDFFVGVQNSANPNDFLKNDVIGALENVDNVNNLTSIKTQGKIQFGAEISNIDAATELRLTLDNVEKVFTLGDLASSISNYSVLAEYLNSGVIRSDGDNLSFKDLGLYAGGNISTLSITSASMPNHTSYPELSDGTFASSKGIKIPAHTDHAGLQIFTREGVHLAGKPLTETEISNLLSVENGFSRDAEYVADYLTNENNNTYIGAKVSRLTSDGDHVAFMSSVGLDTAVDSNLSVAAMASFPTAKPIMSSSLEITTEAGQSISFEPQQGMMAGNIAEALNTEMKEHGITALALNKLEIFDISDGSIQFDLLGDNASDISINETVVDGDTSKLVDEINENSDVTGITAFSSGSGSIVLQKLDGNDIVLKDIATGNNSNIYARQIDEYGEIISTAAVGVPVSVAPGDYIISGGQVKFTSSASFDIACGLNSFSSQSSEFDSGFANKMFDLEENSIKFDFEVFPTVDGNFLNEPGLLGVAASSSYAFALSTDNENQDHSAIFNPNSKDLLSKSSIVGELVSEIRRASPQTKFYANEFEFDDGFPADGSSMELKLGDQSYSAVLNNDLEYTVDGTEVIIGEERFSKTQALEYLVNSSSFSISGPEEGRLFLGFEAIGSGFRFYASAKDGVISGDSIRVSESTSTAQKNIFHIDEGVGDTTTVISTSEFSLTQGAQANFAKIIVGNSTIDLSFDPNPTPADPVPTPTVSQSINGVPANIAGITVALEETSNNNGILVVSIDQSTANLDVRLKATNASESFGLITSSAQITLDQDSFSITNKDNERVSTSATVKSLANEILSLEGLAGEDLIVLATGSGKVSLLGSVEEADYGLNPRELTAQVSSDNLNKIEILDSKTGDILGSRTLSDSNDFLFRDFNWKFDGNISLADKFHVRTSTDRKDDASNLLNLTNLSDISSETGKGGYSQLYTDLMVDVGFNLRASEQGLETSKVLFDVATDRKSSFSGVDLDTEAARLLEQQQAYQALAKVLSTAKEMVDTLLRSM